jgi:hypothetical protein
MSKKSVAHQKKVDESVRILNTTTGVIVPHAMILAGFPKKDIANDTVRRMIRCCLEALEAKQTIWICGLTAGRRSLSNMDSQQSTKTDHFILLKIDWSNGNRGGRDCDVLRCTLPTAWESDVEVNTYDDNDKREFGGRQVNSPPFPIPDVGNVCQG